jgi:hypothetical protein
MPEGDRLKLMDIRVRKQPRPYDVDLWVNRRDGSVVVDAHRPLF